MECYDLKPVGGVAQGSVAQAYATMEWKAEAPAAPSLGAYFFVLIRHGFRGGSGPQRLIRALGKETHLVVRCFIEAALEYS
jgi:hypothetical protein